MQFMSQLGGAPDGAVGWGWGPGGMTQPGRGGVAKLEEVFNYGCNVRIIWYVVMCLELFMIE